MIIESDPTSNFTYSGILRAVLTIYLIYAFPFLNFEVMYMEDMAKAL